MGGSFMLHHNIFRTRATGTVPERCAAAPGSGAKNRPLRKINAQPWRVNEEAVHHSIGTRSPAPTPPPSSHVAQNRKIMRRAATDHEQVPDAVPVGELLVEDVEHDPQRIDEAPRSHPGEALG